MSACSNLQKQRSPHLFVLIQVLAFAQVLPVRSQQPEPGKWIPLPYYRSGSWWLPVDAEKPTKLNASLVALAGMGCYLFKDSEGNETLVHHSGTQILDATKMLMPLDARHFAFSPDRHQYRITGDDGVLLPGAPMSWEEVWQLKIRQARQAPPIRPDLKNEGGNGWVVSSNSQLPNFPRAMNYNSKLGLLCVVQTIGESELGSELRIWDVRSRNSLWRHHLPNRPNFPVSVHILDNGLVFVSGGYGKEDCYLHVYDTISRKRILERSGSGMSRPGRMRVAPLPDGRSLLGAHSFLKDGAHKADPEQGLRLFDLEADTERTLLPTHPVSAILVIPDTNSALVGTMDGKVIKLNLATDAYQVLTSLPGQVITAVASTNQGTAWAAGTKDGTVIHGMMGGPSTAKLSNLDGEVTEMTFLHGSDSQLAIRLAGAGDQYGFFSGYGASISNHAEGLVWDVRSGDRRTLPPGLGLCALAEKLLAIGLSDGTGVVFHDVSEGTTSEPLGDPASPMLRPRDVFRDDPEVLHTNRDGSQIFIDNKLFDFKSLRFEPLAAARSLQPKEYPSDYLSAQEQGGREIQTDEPLDTLPLGPSRTPARVLLYPDPNTLNTIRGISPSGKVLAIFSQWKGSGYLRLVDLARARVMSQPNQGGLTENLLEQNHLEWLKPLDDEGRRVLVIRSDTASVEMLDYAGGRTLSRFEFGGYAKAASCSVAGRRLFIATNDNAIHCVTWNDVGHLNPIGTLNLGQRDSWVLRLPNGMFMANGAERLMTLAGHGRAQPLDTGAAVFHRPHEVARAFGANPEQIELLERAYLRRCQRDGLSAPQQGQVNLSDLPSAIIQERLNLPVAVRDSSLRFTVAASSNQTPLVKMLVSVNGVPLHSWRPELPPGLLSWSGEIPLSLSPGANKIQVSAVDAAGRESLRETVVIWHVAPPVLPALHVVAVGVSDYRDQRLNLGAASKDAHDLTQLLYERQGKDYREVHTLVLTDQEALRESILKAGDFLRKSKEGDQVVVFVAGHGFVEQDGLRYWFGTHDIDVEAVEKRGVSYEELESLFDGVPARHRLLLMDTCFAGEVDVASPATLALATNVRSRAPALASVIRKPPDGSFDLMRELFGDLRRRTGTTVITASSGMEHVYAEEREQGDNGVFTYCLLDGIRSGKADANGDGDIRLSEIQGFLLARVPEMTGGRQQPTGRQVNVDADFTLGVTTARPPLDAARFVSDFLSLTSENRKEKKLASLFTEPANYFGKTQTRSQIEEEELRHHQRFPQRNFFLEEAVPEVTQSTESSQTLQYAMRYSMTEAGGTFKSGEQKISMELIRQEDGWKISTIKVLKSEDTSPPARTSTTAPASPPPVTQQGTLQGAVARFLTLSSANGQEQQFAAMFADTVDYFGTRKTRAQILKEELAYHRDWPYRRLSLVGDVQQINVGAGEMLARYTMSMWKSKTQQEGDSLQLNMEMRLRQINGTWFISGMKVRKP